MASVEKFRKHPESGRTMHLLEIDSLEDWPEEIALPKSKHFVLFLATDSEDVHEDEISALASRCLDQGMVYLSAWGKGSERVHDLFEEAAADWDPDADADTALQSEWHEDEALSEALRFAVASAIPASAYEKTCKATLAVVVGDPDAALLAREWLAHPDALDRAADEKEDVKRPAGDEEEGGVKAEEADEDDDLDDDDEEPPEEDDEEDEGGGDEDDD